MTGLAALTVALTLVAESPSPTPCRFSPDRSFGHCVRIEARRLESSGESPDDVATAAIIAGQSVAASLADLLMSCGTPAYEIPDIRRVAESEARQIAVGVVLGIRAGRHGRRKWDIR